MHLINIKRVAYGLRDCSTLAANDPTFNHPELLCNSCGVEPGVVNFKENNASVASENSGSDNEKLIKLINELVDAMKGGKLNGQI